MVKVYSIVCFHFCFFDGKELMFPIVLFFLSFFFLLNRDPALFKNANNIRSHLKCCFRTSNANRMDGNAALLCFNVWSVFCLLCYHQDQLTESASVGGRSSVVTGSYFSSILYSLICSSKSLFAPTISGLSSSALLLTSSFK